MDKRVAVVETYAAIAERRESGATLATIGKEFGITGARVSQIVMQVAGIDTAACAARRQKRDRTCYAKWGMTHEDYVAHVAEFGNSMLASSPLRRYIVQRRNAKSRGLAWNFTFASWWRAWQESGKWDERARGTGYVMARYNDGDTPYSPGTVYICTQPQNMKDSFIVTPAAVRVAKRTARK